jgi:hypothetical protein
MPTRWLWPRPNGPGYKAAFLKAEVLKQERDATLKELQEHQREHGCCYQKWRDSAILRIKARIPVIFHQVSAD